MVDVDDLVVVFSLLIANAGVTTLTAKTPDIMTDASLDLLNFINVLLLEKKFKQL